MQAGREIKFQAWVPDIGQMVQVAEIDLVNGVVSWYTSEAEIMARIPDADAFLDRVKLRQFTGLRDKNGKEIYEGDIVRAKNGVQIGTVIWVESDCKYVVRWTKDNPTKMVYDSNMSSAQWGEVIGNIYENPELLEVGK
jgi:uncharacterized phage protein (TIGR01671 family)